MDRALAAETAAEDVNEIQAALQRMFGEMQRLNASIRLGQAEIEPSRTRPRGLLAEIASWLASR
jgi:hypothetical protein